MEKTRKGESGSTPGGIRADVMPTVVLPERSANARESRDFSWRMQMELHPIPVVVAGSNPVGSKSVGP
jgi:hypothetical protein